jgi:hypothetical protein
MEPPFLANFTKYEFGCCISKGGMQKCCKISNMLFEILSIFELTLLLIFLEKLPKKNQDGGFSSKIDVTENFTLEK